MKKHIGLGISLLLLAGCVDQFTGSPESTGKRTGGDTDDPVACIALWDPVCGVDGKTYGNSCEAGVAKVAVAHKGECKAPIDPIKPVDPIDPPDTCKLGDPGDPNPGDGIVCIALWDPVCGVDGKTYGNTCEAGRAKVGIAYAGECKPVTDPIKPGDPGRVCTMEYAPVCGTDGRTYSNRCMAGDVPVAHVGECPAP